MGRVVPLSEPVCRLIVRDLIRLIADAEGDPNTPPSWLRSPLPRPPAKRGRGRGRAVIQTWPDGQEIHYPSVTAASKATGYKRIILHRRLLDGRPDSSGCRWRDAHKCNPIIFVTRGKKSGGSADAPACSESTAGHLPGPSKTTDLPILDRTCPVSN